MSEGVASLAHMATPLAIRPAARPPSPAAPTPPRPPSAPRPPSLAVALELLRSCDAPSAELAALTAAGVRVELAWVGSAQPEWMIRLAWLLGVDRRALIRLMADALAEAAAALPESAPLALTRVIEALPRWVVGEVATSELLGGLDDLAILADAETDPRHPAPLTLLCWAASLTLWAADVAEHTDLLRWKLTHRSEKMAARGSPTLPELMREGAGHAAAALRFVADAHAHASLALQPPVAPLSSPSQRSVPWSPRARAASQAAEALRRTLPAGSLLRRLSAARFTPSANWID